MKESVPAWLQALRAAAPGVGFGLLLLGLRGLVAPDGRADWIVQGCGIYALIWSLGLGGAVWITRRRTLLDPRRLGWQAWAWSGRWHGLVGAICAGGALIGGLLYPLVGSMAGLEYSVGEMLRNGLRDGGFYALIWAPGISLVACAMWAARRRQTQPSAS